MRAKLYETVAGELFKLKINEIEEAFIRINESNRQFNSMYLTNSIGDLCWVRWDTEVDKIYEHTIKADKF